MTACECGAECWERGICVNRNCAHCTERAAQLRNYVVSTEEEA